MDIISVILEQAVSNGLKIYYNNFLEDATVVVTSEDASFPAYRLYDRAQGLLFKGTSHPNPFYVFSTFISTPYPYIDTIIIGENHNLTGLTLQLMHSTDNINWPLDKIWVATAGINRQSFTQRSAKWWALRIDNPAANPEIGELFLTKSFSFERNPNIGYGRGAKENFNRIESKSGYAQKTKWGDEKKRRAYHLTKMDDTQRVDLETFRAAIDGGVKNFYIEDLEGDFFFAELPDGLPDFVSEPINRWGIDFNVLEVLD